MIKTVILVVRADGAIRVASRPRIAADEVGVRLHIRIPDGWGKIASQSLEVSVPEPPVTTADGVQR